MKHNDMQVYEVKRSWWYGTIRGMNLFAYRRWWLIWLLFLLALILFFIYCGPCCGRGKSVNPALQSRLNHLDSVLTHGCDCGDKVVKIRDTIPQPPSVNCRVHFSGVFMGGARGNEITKIYELDKYSEFVGSGFYPNNKEAFPKAVATTFDGIAIDKGTHLVLYEKPNFQGRVLLDIIGPALIYNVEWKNDSRYNKIIDEVFPEPLQTNYPRAVRRYSSENMHSWSTGSCKITCE